VSVGGSRRFLPGGRPRGSSQNSGPLRSRRPLTNSKTEPAAGCLSFQSKQMRGGGETGWCGTPLMPAGRITDPKSYCAPGRAKALAWDGRGLIVKTSSSSLFTVTESGGEIEVRW
jgi:hypothetical protein